MVFHNDKFAEIKWDEANRIVITTYKGYMSSEQYRAVGDLVFECISKYKAIRLLVDCRNFITVRPEDQEWTMTFHTNRVFKAVGKTKYAMIMPSNMVQKQVVDKMVKSDKLGNQTFVTASVEEGMAWLRK